MTTPGKYSDEWLHEFVGHLVETNGNRTQAASLMASAELGVGGYYRSKFSQWANGSRLARAARRHPSFHLWVREAEKELAAKRRAEEAPPTVNPLENERREREASRALARLAHEGDNPLPAESPKFDPRWPAWYDKDDPLFWFRGREVNPRPLKSRARSYIPHWANEPRSLGPNEIRDARGRIWQKVIFTLEDPRWQP